MVALVGGATDLSALWKSQLVNVGPELAHPARDRRGARTRPRCRGRRARSGVAIRPRRPRRTDVAVALAARRRSRRRGVGARRGRPRRRRSAGRRAPRGCRTRPRRRRVRRRLVGVRRRRHDVVDRHDGHAEARPSQRSADASNRSRRSCTRRSPCCCRSSPGPDRSTGPQSPAISSSSIGLHPRCPKPRALSRLRPITRLLLELRDARFQFRIALVVDACRRLRRHHRRHDCATNEHRARRVPASANPTRAIPRYVTVEVPPPPCDGDGGGFTPA